MTPIESHDDAKAYAEQLTQRLFDERGQIIHLQANQVLVNQGDEQHRLYLVRNGFVVGYRSRDGAKADQIMRAGTGDLVGVQSFFGGSHISFMTIVALVPTELAYIERDWKAPDAESPLELQLMPAVVNELTRRQKTILDMVKQQQEVDQRVQELERTSALGQLAAGVAHELNNAMTVIARGAEWVNGTIAEQFADDPRKSAAFLSGIRLGRSVSSEDARARGAECRKKYKLSFGEARKLAQTGLEDEALAMWQPLAENLPALIDTWEIGATLNDLQVAARQAEYVVQSMRDLGRRSEKTTTDVDVSESLQIALQILRGATKGIEVVVDLPVDLPPVQANRGELVQVWANLVKNAADALRSASQIEGGKPRVTISATAGQRDVCVRIADNSPGIPDAIVEKIFEPSFTTKKTGLSFGLGLGLSIVQNIVTRCGGQVELLRDPTPGAKFEVTLPIGVPSHE